MTLLIEWLIEGLALAAIATVAVHLVPASSAAQRHLVWWLALLGVLVLPWAPNLFTLSEAASVPALASAGPIAKDSVLEIPAAPSWVVMLAVTLWALTALISLARLAANLRAINRLASSATPLDPVRAGRFLQFIAARKSSRGARVCVSADIRGACAIGFLRPRIVVSSDLVATLDDEAIEAIVLHEYAHLQRLDDWTRLVQCVVLSVTGLHPAVQWISRQIDIEREVACDRLVVERTGSPVAYARALATAAEIAGRMSGVSPIAVPGASMSGAGLHARVSRLLSWRITSRRVAWTGSVAGAVSLAAGIALIGAMPPLVVAASTSIQKPLLALASMPLGFGLVGHLPNGAAGALSLEESRAQNGREFEQGDTVESLRVETANEPTVDSGVSAPVATVDHVPVAAPSTETGSVLAPTASLAQGSALASTSLPHVSQLLVPAPVPAPNEAMADRAPGIGNPASRFGVVTADVASRAGVSVGRFFKNGGLAIANRF